MEIKEVKESIHAAIQSERSQVIALIGDWGVGKTHLWKGYAVEHRDELAKQYEKYAYVSLFGLGSATEIKTAILDKLIPMTSVSDDPAKTLEAAARETLNRRDRLTKFALQKAEKLLGRMESGWGKVLSEGVGLAIDAFEFRAVRKALICIDDLERIAKDLDPAQVMGVIDNLARERACKLVLIFSPENMGEHTQILEKYREKLLDREVKLNPPFSYAIEIGCKGLDGADSKAVISDCATRLGLKNIRVIRRIVDALVDVRAHVPEMGKQVEAQITSSLSLLVYCHLTSKEGVPPLDEVRAIPLVGFGGDKKEPDSKMDFLKAFGWQGMDDFDHLLAIYVENGTCDWKGLSALIEAANKEHSVFSRMQRVKDLWAEYRNRFMTEGESEDFSGRLAAIYVEEVDIIETQLVDNAMDVLRGMNQPHLAKDVFAKWREAHAQDRERLDLRQVETFEKLVSMDLRQFCEGQFAQLPPGEPKDVREVLMRITADQSWGGDDTEFLARAAVQDYVTALRGGLKEIRGAVKLLLQPAGGDPNYGTIKQTLTDALKALAQESAVNRYKVRAMGIEP